MISLWLVGLMVYLFLGLGFSLGSWLEAEEIAIKKKTPIPLAQNIKMWIFFTLAWWVIAIYLYRSEVSRTIPPLDILLLQYEK